MKNYADRGSCCGSTITVNDLNTWDVLFNIRGPCRRPLKERGVYSHNCNKLNKNNMTSAKIPNQRVINSGISASSVDMSRNPYDSFKSQNRCQNPRSGLLCLQR